MILHNNCSHSGGNRIMKKKLWMSVTLMLLMVSSLHASNMPDFPFVFAEGKASIEIEPDIATINFYIEEFNEKSETALDVVLKRSAEIILFFEKQKIAKESITAFEINKQAVRNRSEDYEELEILGYEVRRYFTVKLKNLNNYEHFIHKLLTLKNVVRIRTEFDRVDREKIEADLVSKACKNAQTQAEIMAKGFNSKLGKVFAISKSGFKNLDAKFDIRGERHYRLSRDKNSKFMFIPSTITIKNSISVIYKLK